MPLPPDEIKTGVKTWYDFFVSLKSRRFLAYLMVMFISVTLMYVNASDPAGSNYALLFWTLVLGIGPTTCVYLWTQAKVDVAHGSVEAPEAPPAS